MDRKSADLSKGVYRAVPCGAAYRLGLGSKGMRSSRSSVPGGCLCGAEVNSPLAQPPRCQLRWQNLEMQRRCCLAAAGNHAPLGCAKSSASNLGLCASVIISPPFPSPSEVVYTMLHFRVEDEEPGADLWGNCIKEEGQDSVKCDSQRWQAREKEDGDGGVGGTLGSSSSPVCLLWPPLGFSKHSAPQSQTAATLPPVRTGCLGQICWRGRGERLWKHKQWQSPVGGMLQPALGLPGE